MNAIRSLTLMSFVFALSSRALELSGNWKGVCRSNTQSSEELRISVKLVGKEKLIIDEREFDLTKPQVIETDGIYKGKKYHEVEKLNWHFNETQTEIVTNKEMKGASVDGTLQWSVSGTGLIRLNGGNLEMFRNYVDTENGVATSVNEVCTLIKE